MDVTELPLPSEKFAKYVLVRLSKEILKQFLYSLNYKRDSINTLINDRTRLISELSAESLRSLVDNYVGNYPKYSIFLYKLKTPFFEKFEKLINTNRKIIQLSGKYLKTKKLNHFKFIYLNKTHESVHIFWIFRGKKEVYINETGILTSVFKPVFVLTTFRLGSELVDVRINNIHRSYADLALEKSLKLIGIKPDTKKLFFNNLQFIKNIIEYASKVRYLNLEFIPRPEEKRRYGKIVYSGARLKKGDYEDLRDDEEVKEKIIEAFKSGGIARMNGLIDITGKTKFENRLSFGMNFRENRLYVFSTISEGGYKILLNKLYNILEGTQGVMFEDEKQKRTLLDYIGNK